MLPELQALQDLPSRAVARLRETMTSAVFLLSAAILILVACGLMLAGLYMWLSTQMPDYQAALLAAVVPLLGGLLLIARAVSGRTRPNAGGSSPQPPTQRPLSVTAEQTGAAAARAALSEMQSNPAGTLAAALAVGVMAGMLSSSPRE